MLCMHGVCPIIILYCHGCSFACCSYSQCFCFLCGRCSHCVCQCIQYVVDTCSVRRAYLTKQKYKNSDSLWMTSLQSYINTEHQDVYGESSVHACIHYFLLLRTMSLRAKQKKKFHLKITINSACNKTIQHTILYFTVYM